jgi:hypothetical protein
VALVFIACLSGLSLSSALAAELRRGAASIVFPVDPERAEVRDETAQGVVTRFAAVAVTSGCDYALFEFNYSRAYVEAVGIESLLASAVEGSVIRHGARVDALARSKMGTHPLIEMDFSIKAHKGSGAARYVRAGATVFEASVLCKPGATADAAFLKSFDVE